MLTSKVPQKNQKARLKAKAGSMCQREVTQIRKMADDDVCRSGSCETIRMGEQGDAMHTCSGLKASYATGKCASGRQGALALGSIARSNFWRPGLVRGRGQSRGGVFMPGWPRRTL
eukprot:scaffold269512_cov31-Tisochrysis_lutea.AAC.2